MWLNLKNYRATKTPRNKEKDFVAELKELQGREDTKKKT